MLDRTWELMQKHLDKESFYIVSSHESVPSESQLTALAAKLGCIFPEEFIAHSTNKFGGLYVEVREELWPRPKPLDVGPFWSFLYGLFTYNISEGIPDFMNLRTNAEEFQTETGHKAIPFLKIIGDADVYCFDPSGIVVRWNHELNELEQDKRTFFEILDQELMDLVDRKDRKLADA